MANSIVIQRPTGRATSLVLLFHGVAASADDLLPLGQFVARVHPQAMVVSVNAPQASDLGRGYQWFSVLGVTEQNRPERVAQAMPSFEATLAHWQHHAGVGAERTVLIGFSQGSIMALESTQRTPELAHRVVAVAGRFAKPPRVAPAAAIHLLHGEQDPVIPASQSREAEALLRQLGAVVTADFFPALGHGIDGRLADRVLALLAEP
jgi:phospholipase/carboxylesterase